MFDREDYIIMTRHQIRTFLANKIMKNKML